MELKYKQTHKSVTQYNNIELSDLTVITGLNGSGKSHLLESINEGKSIIDNIPFSEIVLFDYKTFFLENESAFNNQQLNQEKQNAWQKFSQSSNPNIKNNLASYKNNLGNDNYDKIIQIADGKPFMSLRKRDFTDTILFQKYNDYKNKFYNFFNTPNVKNTAESKGLKSLALKIPTTIEQLDEDEFFDHYTPVVLKNDFLPSQIGKLFLDYWYKYQIVQ